MKRIMYISTLTAALPEEEIRAIGRVASQNNKKIGVTGILLSAHEFFFQILEGDEAGVDRLVELIRQDPRHKDLLILKAERGVTERLFPNWSMRTIRLEEASGMILQAIRIMLENITQSHRIIERYTQPSVLRFLTEGVNPLEVPVRKTEKIIVFGDMVGFSLLSQKFVVDEVAEVVNAFLDVCSKRIVQFGGEVTKYIGDCVVGHFRPDQADAAIESVLQILHEVQDMRQRSGMCRLMQFLFCGFGLSQGEVVEGNIGSTIKMDYTVLGDAVNLAARLEALTRTLQRAIAMSETVKSGAKRNWPFERVGEFKLKGQEQACSVYTIDEPVVGEFKTHDQLATEMGVVCEV